MMPFTSLQNSVKHKARLNKVCIFPESRSFTGETQTILYKPFINASGSIKRKNINESSEQKNLWFGVQTQLRAYISFRVHNINQHFY